MLSEKFIRNYYQNLLSRKKELEQEQNGKYNFLLENLNTMIREIEWILEIK